MKLEDILTNLEITCSQNNISTQDVVLLYLMDELDFCGYGTGYGNTSEDRIKQFKKHLAEEHDLLWDLQPTLEEDEDHAFAVQHARDLYNVLIGVELC